MYMETLFFCFGVISAAAIGAALTSVLYLSVAGAADAGIRRNRTVVSSIVSQIILMGPATRLILAKATDTFMKCHLHVASPDLISATFCLVAALAMSLTIREMTRALHPEDADIVKMNGIFSCLDLLLFLESIATIILTLG